jgi:sulfite reductase (NADPH) flavoprotein alpha-component
VGNQVHLTVGAVRYHAHGRDREGVCSTFLAGRLGREEKLGVFVQPNKHFRPPADPNAPAIMVGPGTGIAPFRAFVQEREATGATGKSWLFCGDQRRAVDYLYADEWEDKLRRGVLSRLDLAFSRDQTEKIYVQTRMLEQAKALYGWLQEGAHFYVCGDASRMAHDVNEALLRVVSEQGGLSRERAEEYLKQLADSGRYQRDVY